MAECSLITLSQDLLNLMLCNVWWCNLALICSANMQMLHSGHMPDAYSLTSALQHNSVKLPFSQLLLRMYTYMAQ